MKATKVTLRQRLLNSGKITLYLDFYPPFKDPVTKKDIRHEYLGIYLVKNPKFAIEKEANKSGRGYPLPARAVDHPGTVRVPGQTHAEDGFPRLLPQEA